MKKISLFVFAFLAALVCAQNYAQYINPFIGTGGHGHTFPGATVPSGMVQLSPDTRIDGSWDGCSGYHYSDSTIYGFSHTHLNGTGVSDYGDIMLMPTMGDAYLEPSKYSSKFSHDKEKASAGYYYVNLLNHNIDVELTTTKRTGFHRYTFNKTGKANIILDLNHRDELLDGEVRVIDDKTIEVFRRSAAWAVDQHLYARIEFSKPVKIVNTNSKNGVRATHFNGKKLAIAFSTSVKAKEQILVKVSLSAVSYDGASKNMNAEAKGKTFDEVKTEAFNTWNKEISRIEVKSDDKDKLAIFYTAMYHLYTQPNIYFDVDGKYRGRDNKIHTTNHDYYTVFSLWDTFRAAHPLLTLIDKKRTADFVNTFIKQYEQGGRIPVWELSANETECMIGYHGVSVIADAMVKGITGFDYEKAYEAAKNSAMQNIFGLDAYKKNLFISVDDEHESVSKTVEYAYDDWCIAQMAQLLNKKEDYQYFMKRSQAWKNLYNPENGFFQPRKNGSWLTPFDPREVNNNYTEGNSWHYSFFVPQNIQDLMDIHGGKKKFEDFIDALFSAPEQTTGREQVDITGLIGQYAQGNEPSHHMAYLYNFVGKPEKTDEKIKYILDHFYKNTPDGLIGNEDCGQMSAWYILSSMGIYSVTPGKPEWETTKPYFNEVTIHLEDGSKRVITKNTPKAELQKLGFENVKSLPEWKYEELIATPVSNGDYLFDTKTNIELIPLNTKDKIYYSIGESKFVRYRKPISVSETTTIAFYAERNGKKSSTISSSFHRKPNDWNLMLLSKYNPQYHGGGDQALNDGIYGDTNWRKGNWQGYWGQDFEAVIDFKMTKTITSISSNYLQDSRAWIMFPKKVEYYASGNNKDWVLLDSKTLANHPFDYEVQTKLVKSTFLPTQARFIKVKAYNYGKLPEKHQGVGGDAYVFIDEIKVNE